MFQFAVSPKYQMKIKNRHRLGQAWLKQQMLNGIADGNVILIDLKKPEETKQAFDNIRDKKWEMLEFYRTEAEAASSQLFRGVTKQQRIDKR